jgi:hypothetical protein
VERGSAGQRDIQGFTAAASICWRALRVLGTLDASAER